MRGGAAFLGVTLAVVGLAGLVLALAFPSPAQRQAIWVSAGVAVVVQLFAFAVTRLSMRSNVIAAWGLGAVLRMVVLAAYALFAVRALGLESAAALVSLATFFFLTTLVEPLLLKV